MRRLPLALLLPLGFTASAAAQHADIIVNVAADQLWVASELAPTVEQRVFEGTLNELGIPGYTDDPGFNSATLAPNSLLGYNVHGPLVFWDGADFVAPPLGERFEFANNGVPQVIADGDDGFLPGANFVQASGGGGLHKHLQFTVQHPDFDPGDPFDNPISPGAYAIRIELTSSVHAASEPFVLIFNNQLSTEQFELAVDAAADLLAAPDCPGDLDDSGAIDLDDLLVVLGDFGPTYTLDDLLIVLGAFGTTCD